MNDVLVRKAMLLSGVVLLAGTTLGVYLFKQERSVGETSFASLQAYPTEAELDGLVPTDEAAVDAPAAQVKEVPIASTAPKNRVASSDVSPQSSFRVRREQTFSLNMIPPPPPDATSTFESTPVAAAPAPAYAESIRSRVHDGLLANMTLSAVIDNRAIFKINPYYRKKHGLPSAISLGPGDEFESVSVVTIDGDDVTVSEGQKRTVKTIAALR